jgi:hypothetical protein
MRESVPIEEEAAVIKQAVLQRLNTGGEKMMPQGIRNSFYGGAFSEFIIERLTAEPSFRSVWAPPALSGKR